MNRSMAAELGRMGLWGAYVGWTSLKGSFSDGMPISNECEDIYLIFSGEEHPDCQSVPQLRSVAIKLPS